MIFGREGHLALQMGMVTCFQLFYDMFTKGVVEWCPQAKQAVSSNWILFRKLVLFRSHCVG